MPPKPGNAFAQRKEEERLSQIKRDLARNQSEKALEPTSDQIVYGPLTQDESKAAESPSVEINEEKPGGTSSEEVTKKTTLEVPTTHLDQPSTAGTTMAALLGPETEQEKRGRELVKQQREDMEEKLNRKQSRKSRRSTESSGTAIKHLSAQPKPLFHGKFGQFKKHMKTAFWSTGPTAIPAAFDKPLPAISTPEAAYARAVGAHIPGAWIPSPPYIPGNVQMMGSPAYNLYNTQAYNQYDAPPAEGPARSAQELSFVQAHKQANKTHDAYLQQHSPVSLAYDQYVMQDPAMQTSPNYGRHASGPFDSNAPVLYPSGYGQQQAMSSDQGWPLPSPRNNTGHLSAVTNETNPSQYLSSGNQGMIFSNQFLTPTRAGDFAIYGQPKLVQNHPSMMSMAASVVDPTSPVTAQPSKRASALAIVPEVQETKELQAAYASDVEKLYVQDAEDSQSDPAIATGAPRIPRSRSVPNMSIGIFAEDPGAAARRASTGTNLVVESFSAVPPAPKFPIAATDALIDELYLQLRQDSDILKHDVLSRIKNSRREIQKDLGIMYKHMLDMQKRQESMEGKLDEILGLLAGKGGPLPGGGVAGRLGALGPHTPWGSQSMNGRERQVSAGIPGGLEGAQAWYREARRA